MTIFFFSTPLSIEWDRDLRISRSKYAAPIIFRSTPSSLIKDFLSAVVLAVGIVWYVCTQFLAQSSLFSSLWLSRLWIPWVATMDTFPWIIPHIKPLVASDVANLAACPMVLAFFFKSLYY
eukprot:GHVP01029523.1.p1 GENE.GHVP01029523.1~~GHVP01029523.1.p1  ORF type:complete len:121 (-),score=6.38 GHVP01029523.1:44-406(-)